jgi:hypothetical protein
MKILKIFDIDKKLSRMIVTPGLMLSNWNDIYGFLRKFLTDIKCYGVPSDLRYNLHDKRVSDFKEHLKICGILFNGIENCFEDIKLLKSGNDRLRTKKDRAKFPITDSEIILNAFDKSLKEIL